nr:uncharacterized protein LOC121119887 isoform X1 [Lepeophtheirus salmonis]
MYTRPILFWFLLYNSGSNDFVPLNFSLYCAQLNPLKLVIEQKRPTLVNRRQPDIMNTTPDDFGSTCDDDEVIKGCRIGFSKEDERTLDCFCGVGCERTFPYRTRSHCKEAILKSQEFFDDPCTLSPCQNHGQCISLQFGNFKCECAGTRHYGVRCEKECPTSLRNIFGYGRVNLPADCVNKM